MNKACMQALVARVIGSADNKQGNLFCHDSRKWLHRSLSTFSLSVPCQVSVSLLIPLNHLSLSLSLSCGLPVWLDFAVLFLRGKKQIPGVPIFFLLRSPKTDLSYSPPLSAGCIMPLSVCLCTVFMGNSRRRLFIHFPLPQNTQPSMTMTGKKGLFKQGCGV